MPFADSWSVGIRGASLGNYLLIFCGKGTKTKVRGNEERHKRHQRAWAFGRVPIGITLAHLKVKMKWLFLTS